MHADLFRFQTQHAREDAPVEVRNLRGSPDGQRPGCVVPFCEQSARLDRHRSLATDSGLEFDHMRGLRELAFGVAEGGSHRGYLVRLPRKQFRLAIAG